MPLLHGTTLYYGILQAYQFPVVRGVCSDQAPVCSHISAPLAPSGQLLQSAYSLSERLNLCVGLMKSTVEPKDCYVEVSVPDINGSNVNTCVNTSNTVTNVAYYPLLFPNTYFYTR